MAAQIHGGTFSAARLANAMLESLPRAIGTQLRTSTEALALLAHACFTAVDFRLVGLDEDHRIETNPEHPKALPEEWNKQKNISFKYAHAQSSMHFLLTVSKLGSKAVINALAIGDEKVASLDIPLSDFISDSSLPYTQSEDRTSAEASHNIQGIFIGAGRITDFANTLKVQIIQKLVPKLQKEGYEDTPAVSTSNSTTRAEEESRNRDLREDIAERERAPPRRPFDPLPPLAGPRPFDDPLLDGPRRGGPVPDFAPPGFEDEHGILRPPGRGGFGGDNGGLRGPNIGEQDLYPPGLGPHDPLRIGPGGAGRRGGGGGMYPSFDDPLFAGQGGGGQRGFDPMAPPGARYDPVGPGDGVPRDPGMNRRFPGSGGGGGMRGGPPNPFGGYGSGDFI